MNGKVVEFKAKQPAQELDMAIYTCNCDNAVEFRLFRNGDVQCRACGEIATNLRVFNPREPRTT